MRPNGSPSSAFFLVGPTASGKSAVAQRLAEREGAAILSADSMLIYRGMDIGTAKPTAAERARARYRGLDLADPGEPFSVGRYLQHAAEAFREAGRLIVAGGTGLYIKCLTEGLAPHPAADPERRARLEALWKDGGVAALQEALRRAAPGRLERMADPLNPRRLIRAIEQADAGEPAPWPGPPAAPLAGLRWPAEALRARILERARRMFDGGLPDEVARLRRDCPSFSATARHAIGYAEAIEVLDGRCSSAEAAARTARRTWQLARRQMTWFRHQARVAWVDAQPDASVDALADAVQAIWRTHGPTPVHL